MKRAWVMIRALLWLLLIGVVGALIIAALVYLLGAVAHTLVNLVADGWNNPLFETE